MSRRNEVEVEVPEVEETVATEATEETVEKVAKAKKEPARGQLPEGYVTPVGLTKVINERELHTNRNGEKAELRAQMTYSYIKNAPAEFPFPMETVTDSLGHERQAAKLEDAIDWWNAKNERAQARKASAAQKAEAKAAKAAQKDAESVDEAESVEDDEVVEAE